MQEGVEFRDTPLDVMAETLPSDTRITMSSATAMASMALTMALKYHDINTVQDGTLYQQYKLEGKNMAGLQLADVFDTAMQIEAHILSAPNRLTDVIMDGLKSALIDDSTDEDEEIDDFVDTDSRVIEELEEDFPD